MPVPALRIRALNDSPPRAEGDYVLYWMIANRRTTWNFSLDRALELAKDWKKPIIILEALRAGYRWASDRIHRFVLDGMADNAARLAQHRARGVIYYPYVEPRAGAGAGLLAALAQRACLVITDDFPCFFLPQMIAAAAAKLKVRLEAVDSNGILPMRAASQVFTMAFHFRRWLQKNLRSHLETDSFPHANPLARLKLPIGEIPGEIEKRWPAANLAALTSGAAALADLPIDHSVGVTTTPGGAAAGEKQLKTFLDTRLPRYADERNQPDKDAASGLSPYLHFGHLSTHEIFRAAAGQENWSLEKLADKTDGKNTGWWGVSGPLESFFDELITWREIGYNFCWQRPDYDQFESLPNWVQATLTKHASDPRPHTYSLDQFAHAKTHDPLWNAAQRQLLREGKIHNYLRMLWGKKILEWSPTPRAALATLIELNNRYALDGRNPNSYSGIFWTLGRYDRPWAPERPIFGQVRYMSSENTSRKVSVKKYLLKYGPETGLF